jgi:hypothetical protein
MILSHIDRRKSPGRGEFMQCVFLFVFVSACLTLFFTFRLFCQTVRLLPIQAYWRRVTIGDRPTDQVIKDFR